MLFRFFARLVDDPDSHDAETLKQIKENADGLSSKLETTIRFDDITHIFQFMYDSLFK